MLYEITEPLDEEETNQVEKTEEAAVEISAPMEIFMPVDDFIAKRRKTPKAAGLTVETLEAKPGMPLNGRCSAAMKCSSGSSALASFHGPRASLPRQATPDLEPWGRGRAAGRLKSGPSSLCWRAQPSQHRREMSEGNAPAALIITPGNDSSDVALALGQRTCRRCVPVTPF